MSTTVSTSASTSVSTSGSNRLLPRLREDGELLAVEPAWLEEQIRQGRIHPATELSYGPWTGDAFVPLGRIEALAPAWASPYGALCLAMYRRRPAWAWLTVSLILLGFGFVFVVEPTLLPLDLADQLRTWAMRQATGFEPVLLDGGWATPWSALLVHAARDHLLLNLSVICYSGYRVERALGAGGYALVAAAGVLCGAAATTLMDALPVIGSSSLAFALWGAQLAIGFRFGTRLPQRLQRFYGYGNLPLFGVLAAATVFAPGSSHWCHVGGAFGGVCAAMVAPPSAWARGPGRGLALAALIGLSLSLGPLIRAVPPLAWGAGQEVSLRSGLSLTVPERLMPEPDVDGTVAPFVHTVLGMPAWSTPTGGSQAVFCGRVRLDDRHVKVQDWQSDDRAMLIDFWQNTLNGEARPSPAPPPLGPDWSPNALDIWVAGAPRVRVVEQHRLDGKWLVRAGYLVALDAEGRANHREALFASVLRTLTVDALPDLDAARAQTRRRPDSDLAWLDLAAIQEDAGALTDADASFARAIDLAGPRLSDAITRRLQLWRRDTALGDEGEPWFMPWLDELPDRADLREDAITWLVARGRCEEAEAIRYSTNDEPTGVDLGCGP